MSVYGLFGQFAGDAVSGCRYPPSLPKVRKVFEIKDIGQDLPSKSLSGRHGESSVFVKKGGLGVGVGRDGRWG